MPTRKKVRDYHAILTVHNVAQMNPATYKRFVEWLQAVAREFKKEKDRRIYSKRFRARLMK